MADYTELSLEVPQGSASQSLEVRKASAAQSLEVRKASAAQSPEIRKISSIQSTNMRCVLLPIDGSDNADRAYQFYRNNIKRPGDLIILCNVVEPPNLSSFSLNLPSEEWAKIIEESNSKASALKNVWCEKVRLNGDAFRYQNAVGNKPGAAIVDLANEVEADLIIMGNRGLGKVKRTILGSVSDYVLHHAKIPVTIVPPEKKKKKESTSLK